MDIVPVKLFNIQKENVSMDINNVFMEIPAFVLAKIHVKVKHGAFE